MKKLILLMIMGFSIRSLAAGEDKHHGEYYEYDVKKSRKREAFRSFGHLTLRALSAPCRGTVKCYRATGLAYTETIAALEQFLSMDRKGKKNRKVLRHAVGDFENAQKNNALNDSEPFLYGLPLASVKIILNVLYTGGIRLPRAYILAWRDMLRDMGLWPKKKK